VFDERVRFMLNPDYRQGQSTSLRGGLGELGEGIGAAVILLGDQPDVRPEAIDAVCTAWRDGAGPIVQASYQGRPGHPTLLAREVWPELTALEGDEGARGFIAGHRDRRVLVEVGGRPPEDIDTEQDYRRALSRHRPTARG
jgi:CTP:molybdopterin cytidylyltransferase MocA